MSPKKPTRLVVLSAPSGGGKTTLSQMILKNFSSFTRSVSTTTRSKRPKEKEGVHYHYVDMKTFKAKIKTGDFAEWAEVHGNRYGTSKSTIEGALSKGKNVLFDIDYQGAMSLRKIYGKRTLLLFVLPPDMATLEKRLRERASDDSEVIATRLENAYNEMQWSEKFDYQIINDDIDRAFQEISKILRAECP